MPRHRFAPSLNPLETRLALSTLTTPAYVAAKAAVNQAIISLAHTGNLERASAAVTRVAGRIPLSESALLPLWQAELATVSRSKPGSALQARRDMFLELDTHLHRGVEAGTITLRGPASRQVSRSAMQGLDGFTGFANQTSVTIFVTVSQQDRIVLRQRVTSGDNFYFKAPVAGVVIPVVPDGIKFAVSTPSIPGTQELYLPDPADLYIVANDSAIDDGFFLRVYRDGF